MSNLSIVELHNIAVAEATECEIKNISKIESNGDGLERFKFNDSFNNTIEVTVNNNEIGKFYCVETKYEKTFKSEKEFSKLL